MNNYLFLLFLLLCLFVCLSRSQGSDSVTGRDFDAGNPNNNATIERPCPVYDLHCIRRFFAKNARCKIAHGPVPDPMYRTQSTGYISRVNMTIILTNVRLGGLNGRIEEFYINRRTDNLVIAIEFQDLSIASNYTYFRYHLRAREPIVTIDSVSIIYKSVVMTAVIPQINDLQLDKSEIFVFSNDAFPPFFIGPNAAISSDPATATMFAAFLSDIPTNIQEAFLTDGTFYPPTFIQYNICDFGLKIL